MAHLIDTTTGKAACFVTGKPAWHRLGTVVTSAQTSADAINLAGLNWTVEQWPMTASYGGTTIEVPNKLANVRSDTKAVLGVVGKTYKVLQNAESFAFMDSVVEEGLAMYETAGALNSGRRIWIMARLPGEIRVTDQDEIKPYALLCNGHDGSLAVHVMPTTVRVVCNNTLNLALSKGKARQLVIRHSDSMKGKVEQARKILGLVQQRVGSFQAEVDALARVSLNTTQVTDYFRSVLKIQPPKAKAAPQGDNAALLDSILTQKEQSAGVVADLLDGYRELTARQEKANAALLEQVLENFHNKTNTLPGIAGTAWAAYNAVSEYVDHQSRVTGRTQEQKDNNRLSSIWFGRGDTIKQEAYSQAISLAV